MIRAAAKNHAYVAVVTDPADYARVTASLSDNKGKLPLRLRQELAAKAYARTAAYDAMISNWFAADLGMMPRNTAPLAAACGRPALWRKPAPVCRFLDRTGDLRPGVATATQLQGKQLSYNNINDTDAAFELVGEFDPRRTAAVAIIKHANPCGVAEAPSLKAAVPEGACLRSHIGVRRHCRAQPDAGCGCCN